MKRTLLVPIVIGAVFFSGVTVSYGESLPVQYAETEIELVQAEERLNKVIKDVKAQELREITAFDDRALTDKASKQLANQKKTERTKYLQNITTYKDFKGAESVDEAIKNLRAKEYPVDEVFAILCKEIEAYKKTLSVDDPKKIVKHFNQKAGLIEKRSGEKTVELTFGLPAKAYSVSYSSWTKLTTAEKLLVASNPAAALLTNSIQKKAFDYTTQKFGSNGLGDKSDGYRHGIWNALMARDINRAWAEAISTAHEDRPQKELNSK